MTYRTGVGVGLVLLASSLVGIGVEVRDTYRINNRLDSPEIKSESKEYLERRKGENIYHSVLWGMFGAAGAGLFAYSLRDDDPNEGLDAGGHPIQPPY